MMTPELKAKLAEYARKKRERNPLLKDIEPTVLAIIAVDHFEEYAEAEEHADQRCGYLSRASQAQIDALKKHLPHRVVRLSRYKGTYERVVFQYSRLKHAVKRLNIARPEKYLRYLRRTRMNEQNCKWPLYPPTGA